MSKKGVPEERITKKKSEKAMNEEKKKQSEKALNEEMINGIQFYLHLFKLTVCLLS